MLYAAANPDCPSSQPHAPVTAKALPASLLPNSTQHQLTADSILLRAPSPSPLSISPILEESRCAACASTPSSGTHIHTHARPLIHPSPPFFKLYKTPARFLSESLAVSASARSSFHEKHEVHDHTTYQSPTPQRQQSRLPRSTLQARPSTSSGGSVRSLRRTPRFGDDTDLLRRGPSANPAAPTQDLRAAPEPRYRPKRRLTQDLGTSSQGLDHSTTADHDSSTPEAAPAAAADESFWPKRRTRISRRTAQAILFALEEAIRAPYPFTSDRTEEEARLSQLLMAGLPEDHDDPAPGGPPAVPRPLGENRIRTPTDIMRDRKEREAQRARERERERQRQAESTQRRTGQEEERRPAGTTGVADTNPRQPLQNVAPTDTRRNPQRTTGDVFADPRDVYADPSLTRQRVPSGSNNNNNSNNNGAHRRVASQPVNTQTAATAPQTTTAPSGPQSQSQQKTSHTERPRSKTTSSFPHAFERWETLSSHWEGLTGYWIKKLDANKEDLSRQPLNQQLARQVTDLSSAGANLFHAVVELQRLRASSERKFQRWFFETRKEQEQSNEKIASLEKELKVARAGGGSTQGPTVTREIEPDRITQEQVDKVHTEARQAAQQEVERVKTATKKQLDEMRRELQISRDEARRGWEEIGRLEQSERDRMFALKRGEPTVVGGVQVVPMAARTAESTRPGTREGGLSSHPVQPEDVRFQEPDQARFNYEHARSETDTDPFTESTREAGAARAQGLAPHSQPPTTYPTSSAAIAASTRAKSVSPALRPTTSAGTSPRPAATAGTSATASSTFPPRSESFSAAHPPPTAPSAPSTASTTFYQQPASVLHQQSGAAQPTVLQAEDARSYATMSEDEYVLDSQGNPMHDAQGRPLVYQSRHSARSPSEASEDYGQPLHPSAGYAGYQAAQQAQRAVTSNGNGHSMTAASMPDYEGAGYGGEWAGVPRHHHPTRLSDVLEEDERSRTSPSRASSRSRGFR